MYTVVKSSCIRYQSLRSRFFSSHIGLKQGDPSSPLMFMMFINDIAQNMNANFDDIFTTNELRLFILLYADDAVIFAKSPRVLQSLLHDLETYCLRWGLKINTAKTKVMIFEKGETTHYDFFLNNVKLELVSSFKYLGIHFFTNGNWHRTQKRLAQHASFALHKIFSIFREIELPISEKCKLFDALVSPILNYGAEVWDMYEAKDVEILHNKFCRWTLNVRKSTNLVGLYGELGRPPLCILRKIITIRYWMKLLKSEDNFIPKQIYFMLKQDADNNKSYSGTNWAYQVKHILDSIGLSNIWIQQYDIDIPFNLIKQRILDIYKQTWYVAVNNSNRLLLYSRYKHEFIFEKYLDFIVEKKYRIALSQFRLSSHDLETERGRYADVDRDDHICHFCNNNQIENEYHFLLICPLYREVRKLYMKRYYYQWPTLNKFDKLMSSNDKTVVVK